MTSMCNAVKGPVESATSVVKGIPKQFDVVIDSIDDNDVDVDVKRIKIPQTKEVEAPEEMVQLEKDDIKAIQDNKEDIMKLKESKCVDFDTWSRLSS